MDENTAIRFSDLFRSQIITESASIGPKSAHTGVSPLTAFIARLTAGLPEDMYEVDNLLQENIDGNVIDRAMVEAGITVKNEKSRRTAEEAMGGFKDAFKRAKNWDHQQAWKNVRTFVEGKPRMTRMTGVVTAIGLASAAYLKFRQSSLDQTARVMTMPRPGSMTPPTYVEANGAGYGGTLGSARDEPYYPAGSMSPRDFSVSSTMAITDNAESIPTHELDKLLGEM